MAETTIATTELRVPELADDIHLKIEKYMAIAHAKAGRRLTKPQAAAELLDKATKHIKLP